MARRHIGGPRKHRFTNDIIILGVKATNKHNTYGICKACDEALGREEALKNPVTNKKNTVRNHLKKCAYFCAKLGSQEVHFYWLHYLLCLHFDWLHYLLCLHFDWLTLYWFQWNNRSSESFHWNHWNSGKIWTSSGIPEVQCQH